MAWAPPIWIYLWLAGMAGGGFFGAYLIEKFTKSTDHKLLRLATYLGVPMAVIGVLLLIVDLGSPLRFWHLFLEFDLTSPMSAGTWILLLWVIISVVMIMLWWLSNKSANGSTSGLFGYVSLPSLQVPHISLNGISPPNVGPVYIFPYPLTS